MIGDPGSRPRSPSQELLSLLDGIDIYLLDQLLRGRFDDRRRILDAGCGGGRNLSYLMARGFRVFAIDQERDAIEEVRRLARERAPHADHDDFVVGEIDHLPWDDGEMDAVICSAVLHFARNHAHFEGMLLEMGRVLNRGGLFFARMATTIGLEAHVVRDRDGRARLPDGTVRFLADEPTLLDWTERLGGVLLDPLKTTNVQNRRCMTTWCFRKS